MESKVLTRCVVAVLALSFSCSAQVLPLGKVTDPNARLLQRKYIAQLRQLSADTSTVHFAYPFYFTEALDVDQARQKELPQGSIRIDRFNGQNVLAISGDYYISYSAGLMTANQRARKTYQDIILPLLKLAVARVDRDVPVDGYAFEVAHHVRKQVLKVDTEGPENVMMMFPRGVAERLVRSKDIESQQAALLESEVYLNGEPLTLWLTGDDAPGDVKDHYLARFGKGDSAQNETAQEATPPPQPGTLVSPHLIPQSELLNKIRAHENAPRDTSPSQMQKLQTTYADTLQKIINDLTPQAHFVTYAPPVFIAFHDGAYLQLSMKTDLEQPAGPSQYRIAALAFDSHIAHILRATSKYFQEAQFDGIDFSTTVHQPGSESAESVEFVVPFAVLGCYTKYDCTGQEVINRSIVLINGERVSLDLQRAESTLLSEQR